MPTSKRTHLCCLGAGLVECRGKVMGDRKEA